MLLKSDIELAFVQQEQEIVKNRQYVITRQNAQETDYLSTHIQIVSGVRRCGKSTLLLQLIRDQYPDAAYFNFEEPQIFGFEMSDFSKLLEVMGTHRQTYFFDEIQTIEGWEIFVRNLHEKGKKIYITGSNASMLSKELGTRLTGRYLQHELFPFSYREFLKYTQKENNSENFTEYLIRGGFPEYLAQDRKEILQQLFRDILFRDIAVRHGLKNTHELEQLALFLLSNTAKETTFNSLRKILNLASATTVSDFAGWLQDSYLLFFVSRFSYSAKSMIINPKKVYAVDNGLIKANTLSRSYDTGRLLENSVYLHFRRNNVRINYFKDKGECDFIVFDSTNFVQAFQVSTVINSDNKYREINGLVDAMNFFGLNTGTIITLNQEDTLIEQNKTIQLIPAWKFFYEQRT